MCYLLDISLIRSRPACFSNLARLTRPDFFGYYPGSYDKLFRGQFAADGDRHPAIEPR